MAIEHIGSTAVPGLVAKPILDIAVGLAPHFELEKLIPELTKLGYEFRGDKGEAGGLLFVLEDQPSHRIAHVHAVPYSDSRWTRYLVFRDLLRADRSVREDYAQLKRSLAQQFSNKRAVYTAANEKFVTDVLESRSRGS